MGHTVRESHHTPLDRAKASKLVKELEATLFSDDDVDDEAGDLSDDVSIFVDRSKPPTAEQAKARAEATGYAPHSFVLEERALARLATCRTTITVEYSGRVSGEPRFVAFQRRLFDAIGSSVVESAESTRFETSEAFAANLEKKHGDLWSAPLSEPEPEPEPVPLSPLLRGAAGEAESRKLRRALQEAIGDPFVSKRCAAAMRAASKTVQSYAALLMEDEGQSDERAARALERAPEEIEEARLALKALLDGLTGR